jgi:hypothetical protein
MSQANLVIDMKADRSDRALSHSPVVLIEIPEIKPMPVSQVTRRAPQRVRESGRLSRRSRRRLRREVRLAGCALIALVPIISACTLGWSNRPDRIVACAIRDPLRIESTTDRPVFAENRKIVPPGPDEQAAIALSEAVLLSIEPVAVAPASAIEAPVIFPGYVLPDDSREDSLHEGS